MKKIQANNVDQAKKELGELDKDLLKKLNVEISANEKHYFHVILVTIFPRLNSPKNDVRFNVHQFNKRAFAKIEKNFVAQGFNKLIILHDPTNVEEEETVVVPKHVQMKTEEEIRKELQKEFDEKLKAKTQEALDEYKKEQKVINEIEKETVIDLTKATSEEMQKFAQDNKIDLTGLKNKDEYRVAINTWLDGDKK